MVQFNQSQQDKKLIGAVDHWFGKKPEGLIDNSELMEDLAFYGGQVAQVEEQAPAVKPYAVWPELWPVVSLFLRCSTQWRTGPGGVIGLDYNPILTLAAHYPEIDTLSLIDDLQIMESRALQLIAEAQKKAEKEAELKAKRRR